LLKAEDYEDIWNPEQPSSTNCVCGCCYRRKTLGSAIWTLPET